MLSKSSRLPREEFGSRWERNASTPFFSLKAKKNRGTSLRIGVVVPAAVDKRAVRRNFWKRQAKAALASMVGSGNDALVIVRPKISELTRKEFRETVSAAVARLGIKK